MSRNVKIRYVNHSLNLDTPSVFLFMKSETPNFDLYTNGVAWRTIDRVGRGSSCSFTYPLETMVAASWNGGSCTTATIPSEVGKRYCVEEDATGIVIDQDKNQAAGNNRSIDVANKIHVPDGVSVDLYKDGKRIMTKKIVAYDQKATFVLHPKLYWGMASEIQEGELISSAVIDSDSFFELDLEGLSEVTVGLYGDAEEGYQFRVDECK